MQSNTINEQATSKKNKVGHDIKRFISWPTLFFFEVACSLIVLDCTLRKIQPNIQGGGAKLQRTVQYISADIRYCTVRISDIARHSSVNF